jgi:deazaflavin-dependent oxidoreductase (nitroreductase family)
MSDFDEFNRGVIDEFRTNAGKVGGAFAGMPMVLITHTGARSGAQRTTPLVCSVDGGDVIIVASKAGAPRHPHWYLNLVANPAVTVEHGTERYEATAVDTQGSERDRLYAQHAALMPQFREYEQRAGEHRVIPVLRLVRA